MKWLTILTAFIALWLGIDCNTFTNPISRSAADPWMLYHAGFYYLAATTGNNQIRIKKSKTLEGMPSAPETVVFTLQGLGDMWAPEFHLLDGKWYLYFTAGRRPEDLGTQRIHVIESSGTDPMGPYHYKADLSDPQDDGFELDPSIIRINGKLYLLGSYIRNGLQDLFIRPMSSPWQPSGRKVLLSSPLLPWERQGGNVNEGPEPLQHNGKSFIVYSASFCHTPDYKLGLLTLVGGDPLNPSNWHKSGPVFQRRDVDHVFGPGHNGFFMSPDGKENWIVYHADDNPNGNCDGRRSARAQKFGWNPDGSPNFGNPVPLGLRLQAPSGE